MKKTLTLLSLLWAFTFVHAQTGHTRSDRSILDPTYAPFYHGVASGDPLIDRVIIWTRVTPPNFAPVNVSWELATDKNFTSIFKSGSLSTDSSKDYTVKVDVTGLQAGAWYYYRFNALGKNSLIGRTRTADAGNNDSLRFAVVSCSNYQAGYFNAYKDISVRNDIAAVLHLGDYIYEYQSGGYGYTGDTMRRHEPANEILSLADYRMRHSQYKLDPDLRSCHQQYPFITVWDDHETANDAYKDGAENHTAGTEGLWTDRRFAGEKAYFEWMPIRENNPGDVIHREITFGNLADLIMVDTRLEGREQQVTATSPLLNDTNRTLMGPVQFAWFKSTLAGATSTWKIIGNQVMVSPLKVGANALNLDQWDGYPEERKKMYNHITGNNIKNVVFLTGDIHTSWGNDLPADLTAYNKNTGAGSIAVEYVCTSVTSPGLPGIGNSTIPIVKNTNPYMKYVDLEKKGYLLLDINKQKVQGDWVYVSTVTSRSFSTTIGGSWYTDKDQPFLKEAAAVSTPKINPVPFAPDITTAISPIAEQKTVLISCYPNPTADRLDLQYYIFKPGVVDIEVYDLTGKIVYATKEEQKTAGLYETNCSLASLPAANYVVTLKTDGKTTFSKQIVKQ